MVWNFCLLRSYWLFLFFSMLHLYVANKILRSLLETVLTALFLTYLIDNHFHTKSFESILSPRWIIRYIEFLRRLLTYRIWLIILQKITIRRLTQHLHYVSSFALSEGFVASFNSVRGITELLLGFFPIFLHCHPSSSLLQSWCYWSLILEMPFDLWRLDLAL